MRRSLWAKAQRNVKIKAIESKTVFIFAGIKWLIFVFYKNQLVG
jgi:hypothetical protein